MRVLLIQPPVEDFYDTSIRTWPMGLACLAAVLERTGHAVGILDARPAGLRRGAPVPGPLRYLQEFYRPGNCTPFKLFSHYQRFGLSGEEIEKAVRRFRPDIVGIAAMFTPYAHLARECAQLVKAVDNHIPVVVGGAHATVAAERVLAWPEVDWVVLGEGERPIVDLLGCLEHGAPAPENITALGWKTAGSRHFNRWLNLLDGAELPVPARHLLPADAYAIGGKPYTMIQTSRGCPNRCGFCAVAAVSGWGVRRRPVEQVVQEMVACVKTHGTRIFDIEDDHFPSDRSDALKLLHEIAAAPELAGIELTAMNGLPTRQLDREVLAAMRRAGFSHLDLAMVSARSESLAAQGRPDTAGHFLQVLDEAAALGCRTVAYLIVGLPGECPADTLEAIQTLLARPGLIGPSVLYATPETALYEQVFPFIRPAVGVEEGRSGDPGQWREGDWDNHFLMLRSTAAAVDFPQYSSRQQITMLAVIRLVNYLKALARPRGFHCLAALAADLWRRHNLPEHLCPPLGVEVTGEEIGSLTAAAGLRSRKLLAARREQRQPSRFVIEPEPLDHDLLDAFLRRAWDQPVAPDRPA